MIQTWLFFVIDVVAWHAKENVLVNQNRANPANLANPASPENPSTPNVLMENAKNTKLISGNVFGILVDLSSFSEYNATF